MGRGIAMFSKLSKRTRDSLSFSGWSVGIISTFLTIVGYSLRDLFPNAGILANILAVLAAIMILFIAAYIFIGCKYKNRVGLTIRGTHIEICCGDIFDMNGLRVIGCDTHFDTRVDNVVISKTSLHGRLVLEHGDPASIKKAVKMAAQRLHLPKDQHGLYSFPLGSLVKYVNDKKEEFLMLAMTELNKDYESHTNMALFEQMLMNMWKELDRVYNGEPIAIPLLGTGMTRFDDDRNKDNASLLRCMLCTLNASGVRLKSEVKIVILDNHEKMPLYEFKDTLRIVPGST